MKFLNKHFSNFKQNTSLRAPMFMTFFKLMMTIKKKIRSDPNPDPANLFGSRRVRIRHTASNYAKTA